MRVRASANRKLILALLSAFALGVAAGGPLLGGKRLTEALEQGGYVILMRHANSPGMPPAPAKLSRIT
jgi:hypothetical protein